MKAVIENSTKRVVFLFGDDEDVVIGARGMTSPRRVLDVMPDTHRVEVVPEHPTYVGGRWGWDGRWFALDADVLISAADRIAKAKRAAVVANTSPAEMASWPIKRAEALAFTASGNAADAPSLVMEAQARGIALDSLATKVLAKAAQFAALEAAIAGRCGAIQDAALAAVTQADLAAIDPEAGWPI